MLEETKKRTTTLKKPAAPKAKPPFQTEVKEPVVMVVEAFDNQPEPATPVPLYKKVLCGNNPLGDFHHMFWGNLTCMCCGFYRGMVIGAIYASITYGLLEWLVR